jgi:hypothetical protein
MEKEARGLHSNLTGKQKLQLPDWLSPSALTLYIKFLYLGHMQPTSTSTPAPSFGLLFDLLMIAHFFQHPQLPMQLVFDAMVPQMSLKWSIFTMNCLKGTLRKNLPKLDINKCPDLLLLDDYASFYLSLHLPS